jgi:hypothetical protein
VPLSRIRRKHTYTPPPEKAPVRIGSPPWLAPLMLAFFLVGLLWIVTYYVTGGKYPVPAFGGWNIVAGFGFVAVGFVLSTQWK